MTDEPYPQRRHPAHHPPIERFNEPVIVQVNVCTQGRQPVLAHAAAHDLMREAWQAADFWRVGVYMIMPDHIHLFCRPGRVPTPSLRQWVEYWKGQIAARWHLVAEAKRTAGTEPGPPGGANGGPTSRLRQEATGGQAVSAVPFKLWQRDFWDTQMRSRDHYEEKLAYVRMNPVRKELAPAPEEWPFQGEVHSIGWT